MNRPRAAAKALRIGQIIDRTLPVQSSQREAGKVHDPAPLQIGQLAGGDSLGETGAIALPENLGQLEQRFVPGRT